MELVYPPPHYLFFEPLNDVETLKIWNKYKENHGEYCEFEEIDAAEMNSVDTFSPWFENWITRVPASQKTRVRVLLVMHSEFLTYSCQQMLRRSLEQRSFKCRVWFHIEDPSTIQPAIVSRCIVKKVPTVIRSPKIERLSKTNHSLSEE
jgi:DNA polymerase III delta prime subunit